MNASNDMGPAAMWKVRTPQVLSFVRILAAFAFLEYGTAKLFAFPGPMQPGGSAFPVASLVGAAGVIETIGGTLLLLGLFTRPVAFICSGEMAVAYFMNHAPHGHPLSPVLNQGTPAVLFCLLWFYISSAGAGPWSVDAIIQRSRTPMRTG